MATRPISIKGINSDNTLDLSDHGKTIADTGDTILWKIKSNSGVDNIVAIEKKEGSPEVFSSPPAPVGGSSNWKGTIVDIVAIDTTYTYSIKYTKKGIDGEFLHDPIIQINAKK